MMLRKLLDRYIFTELLSPFSLSLGTLCFIMLTRELLDWLNSSCPKAWGYGRSLRCLPISCRRFWS